MGNACPVNSECSHSYGVAKIPPLLPSPNSAPCAQFGKHWKNPSSIEVRIVHVIVRSCEYGTIPKGTIVGTSPSIGSIRHRTSPSSGISTPTPGMNQLKDTS
mmetsp:Transcript_12531/g.35847  ORF Transcript_12531/g.35847 Transcript_12531/m.35847 type:complete len:102 (-) Transcript_12531:442-747(-)